MRRSIRVALLTAAGLVAIWSFASWAQVIDATPCQTSCHDRFSACISACGMHDDPVECEAQCDDQHDDCLAQCG